MDKPWTIGDLLRWATDDFSRRGIESARLDAEVLLAEALGRRRVDLYLHFADQPGAEALARFRELVRRRRAREPVAHILGKKEFRSFELLTPPGLFIPRPETEVLVDEALARLRTLAGAQPIAVLDLCAGTGAIGLAIARELAAARVAAVDLNPRAGEAIRANALRLGLADRVEFLPGDLFEPVRGREPFNLIACNPPYIASAEIDGLMPEVSVHEPRLALDGGADGLDLVRRLLAEAGAWLRPGGWLLCELGEGQAEAAAALPAPGLRHEANRSDIRGVLRVAIFRRA
jgi:release factor glutamine methyltransferase